MYLKSTEHTLCIYCDFVLRSEWSLINIPRTMGVGPNKLLVEKGFKPSHHLPLATNHCSTLMYADDTVLYYADRDVEVIEKTLNEDLNHIDNWLRNNGLFLHKEKTKCILFGTGARLLSVNSFTVSVKGQKIKHVSEYKYLSVVLDKSLSWNAHVKYALSRAGGRVGMLG